MFIFIGVFQAQTYKNEGNDYFKEKDYKKAVISYSEGLKKKCNDLELNTVLHTNRAAAQFYLGNVLHSKLCLAQILYSRKISKVELSPVCSSSHKVVFEFF